MPLLPDAAAGSLDRLTGARRDLHADERHRFVQLAARDHLRLLRRLRHDLRGLQRREVDLLAREPSELVQAHLGALAARRRDEPHLRQPALQRHLAALEADLVEAARTGLLALHAAAAGLAEPGA